MRAPISIIIPTLNAGSELPETLAALVEGLAAGLIREVIVSDGGSGDDTATLAEAAGAQVLAGRPGRGGQMRRGAEAAAGEWLMFLHADTVLEPGWSGVVTAHVAAGGGAAHFRLAFRARGLAPWVVAAWANARAALLGLPYGDQGLLISRADYDATGGFADIPLMEDVAMARALKGRFVALRVRAVTSAARFEAEGWVVRSVKNGLLLARYLAGADPAVLARAYGARD